MSKRILIDWLIGLLMLTGFCGQASARPDFLIAWQSIYPESNSDSRNCQLCHALADGGDGWNSYGFGVRFQFRDVFLLGDIDAAIRALESINSDGDADNLNNLEEINMGLDPGWSRGNNNIIFFKERPAIEGQASPFEDTDGLLAENTLELCVPIKTKAESLALICL